MAYSVQSSGQVDLVGKFPVEAQCARKRSLSPVFRETSWARDRMATTQDACNTGWMQHRMGFAEEGRFEVSPQSPLPLECLSEKHLENNKMR